jgi:hypothetical protein
VTSGFPPEPVSEDARLTLELALVAGDPVRGTVGIAGESSPLPFCGWIDLMSAINSLRASPDRSKR